MKKLRLLPASDRKKIFPTHQTYSQDKRIDIFLLVLVIILTLFGLLMVFDVSQLEALQDYGDRYYVFRSQAMWVVLGFGALIFCSLGNYQHLRKIALPFFLFALLLLFLVFVPGLGVSAGGAHRWLRLMGFTIQPAEIIKLASVIFFAALFERAVRTVPFLLSIGLIEILVGVFQKDLGSAIVFAIVAFGIYFLAEAPLIYFAGILMMGVLGAVGFILMAPYRIKRVMAFLDPFADPQGFTYHISQVLIALGSGGFLGLGIGQSRQKFAYIPEVTTDSIFSIIGEEFGFFGSLIIITLFGILLWRCFRIVEAAPDRFGKLLAAGLTIWIGTQAAVNLAAMASLIPLTGVPLPFISYGGSALLANLVAIGILLSISKQANFTKI